MQDLVQKINVILNEEKRAYKANGRIRGGLGSFNITIQTKNWQSSGEVPSIISNRSDPDAIKSENANVLLKLYTTLNPQDKSQAMKYLLSNLSKSSKYSDVAYLVIFVLSKIGATVEALRVARTNLKGDGVHGFSNMLAMLSQRISYDYESFNLDVLLQIETAMEGENEYNFNLLEKVNLAKLRILEHQLQDVNPEINYDRDKIISLWGQVFESLEVPNVINEIEEYFLGGEFTPNKFATCIDRVRVLMVDVQRNIASSISRAKGNNKDIGGVKDHDVFNYLHDNKFIEGSLLSLVRSLYGIVSVHGSHAPIARREYARLTKNMAYELILLLLTKYKNLL